MISMLAAIFCLIMSTDASAQVTGLVLSTRSGLSDSARQEGTRAALTPTAPRAQAATGASRHRAVTWGAIIGAMAGVAGGALQPTHSNGEWVLGNSHFTSTVVLGGIGAGIGALAGLAIDRGRK